MTPKARWRDSSLRAEAEDGLLGGVLAEQFAHAEEALHESFGLDVHHGGHLGEVTGLQQVADGVAGALQEEAAAVGEDALAEDLEVAGPVHDLGHEEEADLVVLWGETGEPLAGDVAGDEFDLGEEGTELAHGALDVVGEGTQCVPGDVGGGGPLPLDGLLVEHGDCFRPGFGGVQVGVAEAGGAGAWGGTPHAHGVVAGGGGFGVKGGGGEVI